MKVILFCAWNGCCLISRNHQLSWSVWYYDNTRIEVQNAITKILIHSLNLKFEITCGNIFHYFVYLMHFFSSLPYRCYWYDHGEITFLKGIAFYMSMLTSSNLIFLAAILFFLIFCWFTPKFFLYQKCFSLHFQNALRKLR